MQIRTASQQSSVIKAGGYRRYVERLVRDLWPGAAPVNWETRGVVYAYVNRSSWAVNCPFCRDALVAQPGEPFYCRNCLMQANGGYAREVYFPDERAEIERILLLRANPDTRNWAPHETVDDLKAENLEHGEGI